MDNLAYAEGWTWFNAEGDALSDEEVAAMTDADRAEAFIEGRYAKGSTGGGMGGPGGGSAPSGDMGGGPGGDMGGGPGGTPPDGGSPADGGMGGPGNGEMPSDMGEMPSDANSADTDDTTEAVTEEMGEMPSDGEAPSDTGEMPSDMDEAETESSERSFDNADVAENSSGDEMDVGTPDAGTTQAAGSSTNANNYSSYAEMLAAQGGAAFVRVHDPAEGHEAQLDESLDAVADAAHEAVPVV